jgi:GT2 family glycosyltransferase
MTTVRDEPPAELVSVVIVNYNGGTMLERCLRTVFAQPYRPLDVVVVDNGSSDGSPAMVRNCFPQARLLSMGENLGFAGGNLRGVAEARGRWVILLNNDTEVEPGWIPGLLDAMREPIVGVATSRVVTDGVPDRFYEMNGSVNFLGYNIMRVFSDLSRVFFAGGASLVFERSRFDFLFPAEYFLYQEDVYFSWRLRMEGYDIRMAQGSVVHHRGSATTRRQPSEFVSFYQERNRMLNGALLYESRTLLLLLPYLLVDAAAKILQSLFGNGKSLGGIVRSYFWCVAHLTWIREARRAHQRRRKRSDREIMCWMSSRVLDSESAIARAANTCSRWYARAVGLASYD